MENETKEILVCENCGETLSRENAFEVNQEFYCENCYAELFISCEVCGEIKPKEGSSKDINGNLVCGDCIDEYYYTCEECGELFDANYAEYIDEIIYCPDCYNDLKEEDNIVLPANTDEYHHRDNCFYNEYQDIYIFEGGSYNTCDICGEPYIDDLLDNPHPERFICGECLSNHGYVSSLEELLLPYHSGKKTKQMNTKGYGIELEVAEINDFEEFKEVCEYYNILTEVTGSSSTSTLKAEYDGSLAEGAEFISSILTPQQVIDTFHPLLVSLKGLCISHNYESGAGIHINISYDLFKDGYHMRRFIYLLQSNAKFFYKFSRRSEEQKRWSRLFTKNEIFERTGDKTKRTIEHAYRRNGKYSAFNFKAECLEVRQIRGTLNTNTFKATILFISDLVEFSRFESNYNKFDLFIKTEAARHPEIKKYLEQRRLI